MLQFVAYKELIKSDETMKIAMPIAVKRKQKNIYR